MQCVGPEFTVVVFFLSNFSVETMHKDLKPPPHCSGPNFMGFIELLRKVLAKFQIDFLCFRKSEVCVSGVAMYLQRPDI